MATKLKRNNKSCKYADWTTAKLKKYASAMHDACYGPNACHGVKDLMGLMGSEIELTKRGYKLVTGPAAYVKMDGR